MKLFKKKDSNTSGNNFKVRLHSIGTGLYGKLQNLSRVLVVPIAALPIAGLLLGIGGGLGKALPEKTTAIWILQFFNILKGAGEVMFANLGVIFAIAIAFGFAKASKGVAALSGFIVFGVMTAIIQVLFFQTDQEAFVDGVLSKIWYVRFDPWNLTGPHGEIDPNKGIFRSVLGISNTLDLSVFGGIIVGYVTAVVHNKSYNIRMPRALSFFGGERIVPIFAIFIGIALGVVFFFIWPMFLKAFEQIGQGVAKGMALELTKDGKPLAPGELGADFKPTAGGAFIALFFGILERLLIPTGLHHVNYTPYWFTEIGGVWINSKNVKISGAYNIFFEQIATGASGHLSQVPGTVFMSGRFAFMQYGYPFAALAMWQLARPENKKVVGGILFPAALTSFLTGITEPLLFSFLFVAPLCFLFHAFMAGISFMMAYCFNVVVGQGFAAGIIDFTAFGILPEALGKPTGFYWIFLIGLIMAPAYYFGFYYIIKWRNYQTLGRESGQDATTLAVQGVQQSLDKATSKANDKISNLIAGLGGAKNILDLNYDDKILTVSLRNDKLFSDPLIRLSGTKNIKHENGKINITYLDGAKSIYTQIEEQLMHKKSKVSVKNNTKGFSTNSIETVIKALGGFDNLETVGNCATRLRVNVKDASKVKLDLIKTTAPELIAYGSNIVGKSVQVIYGGDASIVASQIEDLWSKK